MKKLIIIIALLHSVVLFSQDKDEDLYILEADSTWLKEIIKFPLGFAQEINYEGYEDLRFAKNWNKPEGEEFFTYAFVWNINLITIPTVGMIESNMKLYYDGLMSAVNKDKDFTIPKTKANFEELKEDSTLPIYKGKMNVYDSFFTKEVIELNVKVKTTFCKDQGKYVLLFRISTQEFGHQVWKKLNEIKLMSDYCEK